MDFLPRISPSPGSSLPGASLTQTAGVRVELPDLLALAPLARGASLADSRRSAAARSGLHGSRWRGRGVDFRESRVYQAGDDIRHMDWRVTARSGRAHTKVFEEEREHGLLLLIDCNPAMRFGTRSRFKSVQAARAAALLAWMASNSGDRVGVLGFGGGIHTEIKPAGGRRGVLRVLRALRDWDHAADTTRESLSSALQRARRLLHPGMRVIVLSDGESGDSEAWPLLAQLSARHEIGSVLLTDPLEVSAPLSGRYPLNIAGARVLLDFSEVAVRDSWNQHFSSLRSRWRMALLKARARTVELSTVADVGKVLAGFSSRRVPPADTLA